MKTFAKAIFALVLTMTSMSSKAQDVTQTGHECLGILATFEIYLSEIPSDVYYLEYVLPRPDEALGIIAIDENGAPYILSTTLVMGPGMPQIYTDGAYLYLKLSVRQLKMYALGTGTSIGDVDIAVAHDPDPMTGIERWYYTVKLIIHE